MVGLKLTFGVCKERTIINTKKISIVFVHLVTTEMNLTFDLIQVESCIHIFSYSFDRIEFAKLNTLYPSLKSVN